MLPDGFTWAKRWQNDDTELALFLDGVMVACLLACEDGTWTARLEIQRPLDAPLVLRKCRSREKGLAGIEMWAERHEERLRAEVAARPVPSRTWLGGHRREDT